MEKAEKMEERKANAVKSQDLESMMAYLDENGNLTDTPPDPRNRIDIPLDQIQLGAAPDYSRDEPDAPRTGTIASYFHDKGFGFIKVPGSHEQVFVHHNALSFPVKEGDQITFEVEQTPKGPAAKNVRKA